LTAMKKNSFYLAALLLAWQSACLPLPAQDSSPALKTQVVTEACPSNGEAENALDVGDYQRAASIFSAALGSASTRLDQSYCHTGLAEALLGQGDIARAGKELKKALSLLKGADERSILEARTLDDMAWIYQGQNQYDKAVDACQSCISILRSDRTTDPYHLVASLMHLGLLLDYTHQLEKALPVFQEALQVQDSKAGPHSQIAADIGERLGSIYYRLGQTDEANKCFQQALSVKLGSQAVRARYAPHPFWQNVTFRFWQGAPNCLRKTERGQERQIITANGVTVSATISADNNSTEFVKSRRVDIQAANDTDAPVELLPRPSELVVVAPKLMFARELDASELAGKVEKKGENKAKWIRWGGEGATMPVTSNVYQSGGWWGCHGRYGYVPGGMQTVTTYVPDYAAQARALAKAAEVSERAQSKAAEIRSQSLGQTVVSAGQAISGSLYFDASKLDRAILRIPVGNACFEFRFPGDQ
jgi:Tfp pilus assembly protein PilF